MLSIKGMLGTESPVRPKRSESREQQPPSPRSSPESQNLREKEQGGGDSPRDKQGVGALLAAAISAEYASASEEYQPLPPPPKMTQTTMSPEFRQHSTESTPPLRKRKVSEMTDFRAPTPTEKKQKRPPRPPYTKEQEDFIWFCRDDLSMSWRKVVELYNDYWHPFESEPHIRSESGLQSRYYRILDFPVKIRKRQEPSRPDLGLIPSTNRRYPWMGVLTERRDQRGYVAGGRMISRGAGVGRRARSSCGSTEAVTAGSDGRVEAYDEYDEDIAGKGGGGHGSGNDLEETRIIGTVSPNGSDNEYPSHYHQHRRQHDHGSHPRHPHHLHYNTPTRSSQQTNHLRPSNLLTNIDQPKSDGYESSWTTSSSSSTPLQNHQSRCTYPRPPERLAHVGTLLEHIRASKSAGRVRIPRGIRIRQRDRLAGEGEAEGEAERERERRPEARRVDPRLSVTSLCV